MRFICVYLDYFGRWRTKKLSGAVNGEIFSAKRSYGSGAKAHASVYEINDKREATDDGGYNGYI